MKDIDLDGIYGDDRFKLVDVISGAYGFDKVHDLYDQETGLTFKVRGQILSIKRVSDSSLLIFTNSFNRGYFEHIGFNDDIVETYFKVENKVNFFNNYILNGKNAILKLDNCYILYNTDVRRGIKSDSIRVEKIDSKNYVYKCTDTYDTLEEVSYFVNPKDFTINGFYSLMQDRYIPVYSDELYKNDPNYQNLSKYDKYLKRISDTKNNEIDKYYKYVKSIESDSYKKAKEKCDNTLKSHFTK